MFNFSANNLFLLKRQPYDKATILIFKDHHTNRTYKLYDYTHSFDFQANVPYAISGKINSANQTLYLIIETAKIDRKHVQPV